VIVIENCHVDVKIESFSFNADYVLNIVGEGTKGEFLGCFEAGLRLPRRIVFFPF
jgi:hypothetical protein